MPLSPIAICIAIVIFMTMNSNGMVNDPSRLDGDSQVPTSTRCSRVAAYGQQKHFRCRGSIKLLFNSPRHIHIAEIGGGEVWDRCERYRVFANGFLLVA